MPFRSNYALGVQDGRADALQGDAPMDVSREYIDGDSYALGYTVGYREGAAELDRRNTTPKETR